MMECPSEEPLYFSSRDIPRSAAICTGLPIPVNQMKFGIFSNGRENIDVQEE
jgi:hypothetical protein